VTIDALAAANGLRDVRHIEAGWTLNLPSASTTRRGTTYVVGSGDTLERIGRRFGATTSALASANNLPPPFVVRLGQRLTIPPSSTAVVATAPAARSTGERRLPAGLQSRPERLALMPHFDKWARAYGVPADLLKATAWVESGWQSRKVSWTGAVGIGQLMPDTVAFVSSVLLRSPSALDVRTPEHNIRMSARFLRYLLDQTGGRADQALAAYYQGLRSVRERGVLPETRQYVATVLAFRPRFR
jgi:soluble lytic murein transglycosylase-like protein